MYITSTDTACRYSDEKLIWAGNWKRYVLDLEVVVLSEKQSLHIGSSSGEVSRIVGSVAHLQSIYGDYFMRA